MGGAWTLNRDWLTLRSAFFQADMTIPVAALIPLAQGWAAAGFSDVGNNIQPEGDKVWFAEIGFQIDYEDFIVVGEFTRLDLTDTGFSSDDSYYISVGKRFNDVMLHVTFGGDDDELENLLSGVPANVAQLAPLYKATAGIIANEKKEQRYLTAGVKWDFHEVASLKFEVTQFEDKLVSTNDATLLKVALVTVF